MLQAAFICICLNIEMTKSRKFKNPVNNIFSNTLPWIIANNDINTIDWESQIFSKLKLKLKFKLKLKL
jgi:hypothetical protein